jgi:hypothetical protein
MKCPHCEIEIHRSFNLTVAEGGAVGREHPIDGRWLHFGIGSMQCPSCESAIIELRGFHGSTMVTDRIVYPSVGARSGAPKEVPPEIASDFNEAGLIVDLSPKASAALSRRCLQAVLWGNGFPQRDLAKQIDAALLSKALPSSLAENVDSIRNIGNFAAHPLKDTNSGVVLEVAPHEAEWNLEVLEGLFDHFYVAPAKDAARKLALAAKLTAAGKPPMK